MSLRARHASVVVVAGLLGGMLACQVFVGLEAPAGVDRPDVIDEPPPGAGGDPCVHARLPPPPTSGATGGGPPHWFVMSTIAFPALDDAGVARGYDLDDSCTCLADLRDGAPPCINAGGGRTCDGPGGVDNTFAGALGLRAQLIDIGRAVTSAIAAGGRAELVYLTDYNGLADDDSVGVSFVPSDGLYSNLGCHALPRADASAPSEAGTVPAFDDGCDRWSVHPDRLLNGAAIGQNGTGYVTGYRLVTRVPVMSLSFLGHVVTVRDGVFTARLEPVTAGDGRATFQMVDGIAAGRAPIEELAAVIGNAAITGGDATAGDPACASPLWPALKRAMCESADTLMSPSAEYQGAYCDAFSATWGFIARPSSIDPAPRPQDLPTSRCAPVETPDELCAP